eukprot:scaffold325471_cov54-Tisochrysis_lutea.AAC.1
MPSPPLAHTPFPMPQKRTPPRDHSPERASHCRPRCASCARITPFLPHTFTRLTHTNTHTP